MKEKAMKVVFLIAACVSILAVALICIFLFANGIPAIKEIGLFDFLTGTAWKPGNHQIWDFADDIRKYICDRRSSYCRSSDWHFDGSDF